MHKRPPTPARFVLGLFAGTAGLLAAVTAQAAPTPPPNDCVGLPVHAQLEAALKAVVGANGGLNFPMWATVVNRYGVVCAVASTGTTTDDAWLNSRVISAQKAYTANGFSRPSFALSTADLFTPSQNGGSLNGLQFSNPVDPRVVYRGDPKLYGTAADPMLALRPGGINISAAAWRCTAPPTSWGRWASAATPPAPTTTSPGSCATGWPSEATRA